MANTAPIFSLQGEVSSDPSTTPDTMAPTVSGAANDYTGIDADYKLVFTADPTNGGYISRLRFKAAGSNGVTVARIFINNGSTPGTATNNSFYGEISLPATTASATLATAEVDYPMGFALNPGYKIYVGVATAVTGWVVTAIGGKY